MERDCCKAKVLRGERRVTCTAQEVIVRLQPTLVRYLSSRMPSLSHRETRESRAGSFVTGNHYFGEMLRIRNAEGNRIPDSPSPPFASAGGRQEGGRGGKPPQPEISLQPGGLSSQNF